MTFIVLNDFALFLYDLHGFDSFALFFMICMVFTPVHDISIIFLILIEKSCKSYVQLSPSFFLINHNSHVEISYLGANLAWFDLRGPAGTCGDLRGPVETCWDRSSFWAKSHLDLHFCANSNFHTCFLCFCSKV